MDQASRKGRTDAAILGTSAAGASGSSVSHSTPVVTKGRIVEQWRTEGRIGTRTIHWIGTLHSDHTGNQVVWGSDHSTTASRSHFQ